MKSQRLIEAVYSRPWNITGNGWMAVHQAFQGHLHGAKPREDEEDFRRAFEDFIIQRPHMEIDDQGVAHIHVMGVLAPKLPPLMKACGLTDYGVLTQELQTARRQARAILLIVDSPGGYCEGNAEVAYLVSEIARSMPVTAWTDGSMCSAAYKIAVGARRIWSTPSADTGSIGTIIPLVDTSGAWEQKGWKPAYVTHTGGDLKAAGYPPSFTEEHMAYFQELVDDTFSLFRNHVLANRSIDAEAMRGQVFTANRALAENLIDAIGLREDAYRELLRG
tara:strand:+ start:27995 stop:28825 length:831 start_codon:yes stop_codon:yes gene_type:complete